MPTPFPGIDPYLERPTLWPDVYNVRETYLEVRATASDRVITLLEILLPTNKRSGDKREQYLRKRRSVLASQTHLVEFDFLRGGESMPLYTNHRQSDYHVLVSRAPRRPRADLFPFSVRQPTPTFRLPLHAEDEDVNVDMNHLLHTLYDRASYDLRIDYHANAEPPLSHDDALWADALLRAAGVR